ncbi:GspL/Epsl periplasmic domain-containing protein [Pseudomonas xantholysinigenes]|uniref:Type II secretion system protein GspL n=1 Tax=Pseudomonas xantholysinigenes TaxID=2745490 RepID=A0A9E6TX14_9PSED|nr:GspL/Epsl periplasmic domain-containing protein [Pseudomonas xantholysinigenes]QXI37495.1 type II secretion system protein GspL [Pseudomonas xantholysinigenes]
MKREWWRRAARQPWLLVRPGEAWGWLLVEHGLPVREGTGAPPTGLDARVALVVPGEHCSHFQLTAPPGLKREEWPLLLEDRLAQACDEVVCAGLGRQAGELRFWVVSQQALARWREQCAQWGLLVERCWAEFQLLPELGQGEAWQWQRGEMDLFQGRDPTGRTRWLAWPRQATFRPALTGLQGSLHRVQGRWPETLANFENLPGLFETRRARASIRLSLAQRRLMAACLLLAATWGSVWGIQQWRQAQLYREQVVAVTGVQASPGQAAQALRRLRGAQQEHQVRLQRLDGLQAQLQDWLSEHPGWQLRAVRFDGQRWHLELEGDGEAPPWQAMAAAQGAQVTVDMTSRQASFDLEGA